MLLWAFLALLTEPAGLQAGPYGCLMMKTSRAILALKVAASSVVVHCCRKLQVVAETKLTLHVQPWIHIIKTKFMLMLFNQGRVTLQIGWIFGNIPNGLRPAPLSLENYIAIFYNGYGCIYARRYESQIVWNACTWFPKIGIYLIFLNTIVEKTYPEPWIYSFLY